MSKINSKNQTPPMQQKNQFDFKKLLTSGIIVLLVAAVFYFVSKQKNLVEVDEVHNYVCQIIDTDIESGMMAMKCLIK